MSKLLIDDHPIQVLPTLAVEIGLNEAIVLQQVHYWLEINRKANKNFKDGYYWTYNSVKKWRETNFPWWSHRTLQRIFESIEESKLLIVGNYNRAKYDKTKWYRIDYPLLKELESGIKPLRVLLVVILLVSF